MTDVWIKLRTGRDIHLKALHQQRTYESLLAGHPDEALNREIVWEALERAFVRVYGFGQPHLIPPVECPIPLSPEELEYPRSGEPIRIPDIVCTARFESYQPVRNPAEQFSCLVIVWFQDYFAPPIDKAVLDTIQSLDWETLAADGSRY
jgi:hypothetical protein